MALIGMRVQRRQDHQLRTLQVLSGHFLDVVRGLTTLKVFGRSKAQIETIRSVTDRYRRTTMSTLKLAFLSSLVLELLASVSVALVAVSVGLRLLYGHLDLRTSLFALVLVPEAYLPLRLVGTSFHASAEGLSAADEVFEVLERPVPEHGTRRDVPDPAAHAITVDRVTVAYPGRPKPAIDRCSLTIEPGESVAITGPSGSASRPWSPRCSVSPLRAKASSASATSISPRSIPRRGASTSHGCHNTPHLFATSIADNLRPGRAGRDATTSSGAPCPRPRSSVGSRRYRISSPRGSGERGSGLSAGEAQRPAIAACS